MRRRKPFITAKGKRSSLTELTATTTECKSSKPSKKALELSLFQPKKPPSDETPVPNQNLKGGVTTLTSEPQKKIYLQNKDFSERSKPRGA